MSKADYLERAKAEVARAQKRLPDWSGDCGDCRWSRGVGFLSDQRCGHPAIVAVAFNVADAYAKERIQTCGEQRDRDSVYGPVICGPDGALFEARGS